MNVDQAVAKAVQCNWKRARQHTIHNRHQMAVTVLELMFHQLNSLRTFAEELDEDWSEEVVESTSMLYKICILKMEQAEAAYQEEHGR